jgi:transposase
MGDDTAVERVLRSAREVVGEVMPGLERRRKWSTEEKLRILAQSVAPGSSPTLTCKMHGISSGQLCIPPV